ncbi:GFA family protein [Kiritimatiellota bacterium B12222]|nr:GFA family protein [Kiritimatiellota bacterium B12222]
MSEVNYPITGACQCGAVSYILKAAPLKMIACHCTECQKLSTSAFSITALVPADSIEFTGEMKEWSRGSDSGNENAAKFCPHCGNRIYHYNPADPSTLKLKIASISDTRVIQPTMHTWVSQKQAWFDIPPGVTVFEKQPGVV